MKSRMLNSIVVVAIFVVLAIPTMIAAQEPSTHACDPSLVEVDVSATGIRSAAPQEWATALLVGRSFQGLADLRREAN